MIHFTLQQQQQQQQQQEQQQQEQEQKQTKKKKIMITIKQHRVQCIRCRKPAVRYQRTLANGRLLITYEHRDEPPTSSYLYKGKKVYRYRRCSGGTAVDALPVLREALEIEPQQQQQQQQQQQEEKAEEEEEEEEEEPPASNTIINVVRAPAAAAAAAKTNTTATAAATTTTTAATVMQQHRPSNTELMRAIRILRNNQGKIMEEQRKVTKELHAIRSIMEMWIKGDLKLVPRTR